MLSVWEANGLRRPGGLACCNSRACYITIDIRSASWQQSIEALLAVMLGWCYERGAVEFFEAQVGTMKEVSTDQWLNAGLWTSWLSSVQA